MTPEREADIREILSGNANPAHVRVESAAHDLLAALDAERVRVAEWTAEALERDAEVARWQSEARDLVRVLADVRQRCGGYPDSRVDGDGGIVAVVVRERDEAQGNNAACGLEVLAAERERDDARRSITCARYCLENDHGEAAVRACLDGMGMAPGIAEEYQSDLDRVTLERDEARRLQAEATECSRVIATSKDLWQARAEQAEAALADVRRVRDACLVTAVEAERAK